ncbi:glycoside hydrolase family 16 protein [Shinella sp. S4-D37]|uniref:endo-1,3-1,4-beta-glycanase ExoK n=1 Tax=Shinella sp. S4-D37 TaxID=3161999 RepID=UPI003467561E
MTAFPKNTLRAGALLAALAAAAPLAAQEGAGGASFVEEFDTLDKTLWYVSDGWNNGAHQNCTWSKDQVAVKDGRLRLSFDAAKAGERDYACGEVQTRKRYGYGTYEVRMKAATGPGLNSAFFTYIGPADKKPHDEIDFEVLGKDTSRVQLNQYVAGKGGNEKLVPLAAPADGGFNDYAFVWQKERLRYYVNGALVHEVTNPAALPDNAQKVFLSLWGSDTLTGWMGRFAFAGPTTLEVERVAFTAEGDACPFAGSVACLLN